MRRGCCAGDVRERRRILTFDVIIPWRGGCPYRQLALDWVIAAHDSFGRDVILGELDTDAPWSKARAVRAGLEQSTSEVIVISDGDVWSNFLEQSIDMLDSHRWVTPFLDVHRLSPAATSTTLQTSDLSGRLEQRAYRGVPGGGMLVMRREDYELAPMDPRFVGWGQEDEAWGDALATLLGAGGRNPNPLYHLWHPPQERQNRAVGSEASRALRNRYTRAKRIPGAMEALISEIHHLNDVDLPV